MTNGEYEKRKTKQSNECHSIYSTVTLARALALAFGNCKYIIIHIPKSIRIFKKNTSVDINSDLMSLTFLKFAPLRDALMLNINLAAEYRIHHLANVHHH